MKIKIKKAICETLVTSAEPIINLENLHELESQSYYEIINTAGKDLT